MANTVEEELQGIIERNETATPAPENKVETPVVENTTQVEEPAEEVQTSTEETPNEIVTTTTETTQEEPTNVIQKTWKEILAEQNEQEQKEKVIEKAKRLAENPIMKLAIEAEERGEDWLTIVNSIADIDVKKIPDEQLFKNSLQGQNLTEEDIQEAWEDFKDQKEYLKKPLLELERNKIQQTVEDKRKQLNLKGQPKINYSEVKTKADNSLEALLDKLPNEVEGVKLTTERKAELFKATQRFYATYSDKDGNIDISEAFDTAFAKLSKQAWKKDIAEAAKAEGRKEAFEKTHNPNANTMVTSSKPKAESREDKELREYMERINQAPKSLVEIKR